MGSLIVGTGFVAGEVELEDLWLVGDTGAGNDYVIETKDTTWSINHVFTQGGDLGCVLLQGSLHRLSDMSLNLTDDIGILVTGDNTQVTGIYIASPGGEAIHFTSAAASNLFSNVQVATAWNGAGTGPAILIDGDDNTLTQVRVRSNAGATYAIEIGATGDANTIGVVHLDTGATGIINDGGTNTVIYSDSSHAHTGGGGGAAVDHTDLANVLADQHHTEAHTAASHSDQGATGAELETLTDGSNADALHAHAAIGGADHGGLLGLGDDDHTQYLLVDATRASTGTQRFNNGAIYGAAGDTQLEFAEDANDWRWRMGNNADVFLSRFVMNSSDHANASDIYFLDTVGGITLNWDSTNAVWQFSDTARFKLNTAMLIGNAGSDQLRWLRDAAGIWNFQTAGAANVFTKRIVWATADHANAHDFIINDGAGAETLRWDNSAAVWQFSDTARFKPNTAMLIGNAGSDQLRWLRDAAGLWNFQTAGAANAFVKRMIWYTVDHANAHDWDLNNGAGATRLRWDNSAGDFLVFADWNPGSDVAHDLGSATLTWRDLFVDNIKDRAGATTYVPQTATFPTAHIFSSDVEIDGDLNHDGTNVGFYGTAPTPVSAAYTPTNVTADRAYDADSTGIDELADIVGTLIADLQLTGIIA